MMFKKGTALFAYEVLREAGQNVMYINYLGAPFVPSVADNPEVMARTIDSLIETPNVSRIVFVQQRNYNYDFYEVSMLLEIAQLYTFLIKQEKILSPERLSLSGDVSKRHESMTYFITILRQDPIASYHEIKRFLREERAILDQINPGMKVDQMNYLRILEKIKSLMENLSIIRESIPHFEHYVFGSREIYEQFFRPDIIPNFTFTRLVSNLPEGSEIVDQYNISSNDYDVSIVTILKNKVLKGFL